MFRVLFKCSQIVNLPRLEPVGTKSPAFASDAKGFIFEKQKGKSLVLLCPAQGMPVPIYRFGQYY